MDDVGILVISIIRFLINRAELQKLLNLIVEVFYINKQYKPL